MLNFEVAITIIVLAFLSTTFFLFKAYFRGRMGSVIIFIFSVPCLLVSLIPLRGKENPITFYFGLGAWLFLFVFGLIASRSKKE